MKPLLLLLTIVFFLPLGLIAQTDSSNTYYLSLSSENDFLGIGKTSDQYYSFGEKLDFLMRMRKESTSERFLNLSLKLEGHTPRPTLFPDKSETRRPFFGWLFGNFSFINTNKSTYLKYGVDIGISGPSSRAGFYQNWYHENIFLDNKTVPGWENQTPDKVGVNLRLDYKRLIYSNNNSTLRTGADASIGNIFTFISPNLNYRWTKINNQAFLPYRYNSSKANRFMIECEVALSYEFQNAALTGEHFSNQDQYLTNSDIFPFIFKASLGARYSFKNLSIFANNSMNSVRVKSNETHHFGQFGLCYHW